MRIGAGTGNTELGFAGTEDQSGTGDVADINAVTATEIKTVIEADTTAEVVVDPLIPNSKDSSFIRLFLKIEQGRYLRTGKALVNIIEQTENLSICNNNEFLISASPFGFPVCARFGVYRAKRII